MEPFGVVARTNSTGSVLLGVAHRGLLRVERAKAFGPRRADGAGW